MIRVLEFADVINRHDFIETIVHYANDKRFEISVCVRSEVNNIAKPQYPAGMKYAVFPGNSRSDAVATAWKLSQLLRDWKIDILHTHHFEQSVVGWLATRFYRRTKLIIGRHYSDSIYRNPSRIKRRILLAIEQLVNRHAERIIVPSQMIFDLITKRQNIPSEKIDIVHYGFVPEKYSLPAEAEVQAIRTEFGFAGKFSVSNFGRYHEEKGHRYLLEALVEIKKEVPDVIAVLVGEGPERQEIERRITDLGIEENVILAGWRRDALTIMAASDLVVQSTLQEAFSQVMCEAMWMEKPLIITDVSGAADVIEDGVNGLIAQKADSQNLATAIRKLYTDLTLRHSIAREARKTVETKFPIEKIIRDYEESFERAMWGI